MTKEQAIEILKEIQDGSNMCLIAENQKNIEDIEHYKKEVKAIETVLNIITKLQKENEEKDKQIKELKQNIDYQVLCDFLISSVSNEEPIWTEKHIEELLENFEMRWKNAYK